MTTNKLHQVCKQMSALVDEFLNSDTKSSTKDQLRLSISIIEDAFNKHSMDEIAMSFNGGKDCLVMLIVFLATLYKHPKHLGQLTRVPSVYVHFENSFQEVDQFVEDCKSRYCLDIVRLAPPIKDAFQTYLNQNPKIKAILVGIRRADPYGETLTYYERTDHGWPDFIRVHPVLEWHFVEVWDFLRHSNIPYCVLYDQGYTSLGGTNNTRKNPTLLTNLIDEHGNALYKPAYDLIDDEKERLSRMPI